MKNIPMFYNEYFSCFCKVLIIVSSRPEPIDDAQIEVSRIGNL